MDKPSTLGEAGSTFWDEVTDPELDLVLRPDEYRLLDLACATLDTISELDAAFNADPHYTVRGSQGQPVINPLIAERRTAGAAFAALARALQIPDVDQARADQRAEARSGEMRKLGQLSWAHRKPNTG